VSDFEVFCNVSYSFSVIVDAENAEAAAALDPVQLFQSGLEQGDLPDENDIDVEFAQPWKAS
jgi:hypothetical protein